MKEQTINLFEILEKIPLEDICKEIPLKVYDNFNNLIWGNDLGDNENLMNFPIATQSGIPLASIKTRESHKGLLRKIILNEVIRFVREEIQEAKGDEISLFYSDLENLAFNKNFLNFSFNRGKVEEGIAEVLQTLRKYYHYEVCNIYVYDEKRGLDEFMEISSEGQ